MATWNVSTARQFIDAILGVNSTDTIEILTDLDWNEVLESQRTTVQMSSGSPVTDVTINGNNHAIYNIDRSMLGSASSVFSIPSNSSGIVFNNLSYLNVHLNGTTRCAIWSTSNTNTKFNGGVIVARVAGSLFTGTCDVNNMMITFDVASTGNIMYTGTVNTVKYYNCWIYIRELTFTPSSSNKIACDCTRCYFKGGITQQGTAQLGTLFDRLNSCCINVQIPLNANCLLNAIMKPATSGEILPSILNSDKIIGDITDTSTALSIMVTNEQMKNAEYLASVGFDIVP